MTQHQDLEAYRPTVADLDTDWSPTARAALRDSILLTARTGAGTDDPRVRTGRTRRWSRTRLAGVAAAALIAAGGVAALADIHAGDGTRSQTFRLAGYKVTVPTWAVPSGCLPGIVLRKLPNGQALLAAPKPEPGRLSEYVSDLAFHPHSTLSCVVLSAESTNSQPPGEHRLQMSGHAPIFVKTSGGTRSASYPFGGPRPGWSTVSISTDNSEMVLIRIAVELRDSHVLLHS